MIVLLSGFYLRSIDGKGQWQSRWQSDCDAGQPRVAQAHSERGRAVETSVRRSVMIEGGRGSFVGGIRASADGERALLLSDNLDASGSDRLRMR